ncbi:MAG: hypothetical protein ACKOPE_05220 [Novosphingobium sp.]
MFGPTTTAGLIDEFASRFTTVSGARFLIAPNGDEAWPISERESVEFLELYRRRMMRARLIRRAAILLFPVLLILGWQLPGEPRWLRDAHDVLISITLFAGPFIGFLQHKLTSDITKEGIERQLERRITTSDEPSVTPTATPLARAVRKTLILAGAVLMAIEIWHMIGPREEFAGHMRVLTGLTAGNESALAHFTGRLTYLLVWTILIGSVLLWLDRRKRLRSATVIRPPVEKPAAKQSDVETT